MRGAAPERPLSVITPLHFAFFASFKSIFFNPLKKEKLSEYTFISMLKGALGFLPLER